MRILRRIISQRYLSVGVAVGAVVVIMSATGVLLTRGAARRGSGTTPGCY